MAAPAASRRSPGLGHIEGLPRCCKAETSLEIFRRICYIRHFELRVRRARESGEIDCPVYLSAGQEAIAAAVSTAMEGAWVLAQHRGHSAYLAFGGDPVRLVDELLGLPSGCCGGVGGSPPIQDFEKRIIGHNGLIGDHVPVAAGVALGRPGDRVICFFGDGAAEEDYVLGALGFAASRRLSVLFVCEDNDLSVLTPTADRRSWLLDEVAGGFGMPSVDIGDDPWLVEHWTRELGGRLPALLNVRTCRQFWHVGTGCDGKPEWDRFALVRGTLAELGLEEPAAAIEAETLRQVEELWNARLQIRSAS